MDDIETQETNPKIIKHMLNLYENNLITPDDLASILERLKDKTNEKNQFHVMVMDMLGPSLEDLFMQCKRKFDLKTCCLIS